MRRLVVLFAIGFQVLVLAAMAAQRESILAWGKPLTLRTRPLDPRDFFRGDYVRLDYAISAPGPRQIEDRAAFEALRPGDAVYAVLRNDAGQIATLDHFSVDRPDEGAYLRGQFENRWGQGARVRYGIETYFVEQGRGREMEKRRGARNGIQVPLLMSLAVGDDGTAVLKGHAWSPIGIGIEVHGREPTERAPVPTVSVTLSLMNASARPLALVALPDDCSFALEPVAWSERDWKLAHDPCASAEIGRAEIITLQPEQTHEFAIDLAKPRWYVQDAQGAVPIGALGRAMFRLIYRPPSGPVLAGLGVQSFIWQGELPSRAFSGRGRVD